eukprot:scaffold2266_cov112-Isochrysis_galbana.AAC.5
MTHLRQLHMQMRTSGQSAVVDIIGLGSASGCCPSHLRVERTSDPYVAARRSKRRRSPPGCSRKRASRACSSLKKIGTASIEPINGPNTETPTPAKEEGTPHAAETSMPPSPTAGLRHTWRPAVSVLNMKPATIPATAVGPRLAASRPRRTSSPTRKKSRNNRNETPTSAARCVRMGGASTI